MAKKKSPLDLKTIHVQAVQPASFPGSLALVLDVTAENREYATNTKIISRQELAQFGVRSEREYDEMLGLFKHACIPLTAALQELMTFDEEE